MSHIFISYSRSDLAVVDQIAAAMIEKLIPIWMDRVGITGGDQWRRQIVEAIEDCDAFLLVLSNSAVVSDNVRKEVDLAEHFNKRIIPVEIEVTDIPRELSYQLIGIQRIDMIDDTAGKLPNLLSLLVQFHQSIQHPATEKTSPPPAAPEQEEPSTLESPRQQAASSTETAPEAPPSASKVTPAMPLSAEGEIIVPADRLSGETQEPKPETLPASAAEVNAPDESIQQELESKPSTAPPGEATAAVEFEPISPVTAASFAASISAEPETAVTEPPRIEAESEPISKGEAISTAASDLEKLESAAPPAPSSEPTPKPEFRHSESPRAAPMAVSPAPVQAGFEPAPQDAQTAETSFFKRLPPAAWVGGAVVLVVIVALILGLSGVFGGGGAAQPAAKPTMAAALLAASSPTETRIATQTKKASPTKAPTETQSEPTQTPTDTISPTPNPTPTNTPTLHPAEGLFAEAKNWDLLMADNFSTVQRGWILGANSNQNLEIRDGKYYWEFQTKGKSIFYIDQTSGIVDSQVNQIEDFFLSVQVQQISGPKAAEYGLVFGWNNMDSFYRFSAQEHRKYAVIYYDSVRRNWSEPAPWNSTITLKSGNPNQLAVISKGSQLYFYINGNFIIQILNQQRGQGSVGLGALVRGEQTTATWEFDNFELRVP